MEQPCIEWSAVELAPIEVPASGSLGKVVDAAETLLGSAELSVLRGGQSRQNDLLCEFLMFNG